MIKEQIYQLECHDYIQCKLIFDKDAKEDNGENSLKKKLVVNNGIVKGGKKEVYDMHKNSHKIVNRHKCESWAY